MDLHQHKTTILSAYLLRSRKMDTANLQWDDRETIPPSATTPPGKQDPDFLRWKRWLHLRPPRILSRDMYGLRSTHQNTRRRKSSRKNTQDSLRISISRWHRNHRCRELRRHPARKSWSTSKKNQMPFKEKTCTYQRVGDHSILLEFHGFTPWRADARHAWIPYRSYLVLERFFNV